MQSTALQFSLPTFDELRTTAARPRHIGVGKTRIMNVIAAVPALNLLKVAAYCRVSTDHDDQQESITIQQEHWKTFAAQHPEWDHHTSHLMRKTENLLFLCPYKIQTVF